MRQSVCELGYGISIVHIMSAIRHLVYIYECMSNKYVNISAQLCAWILYVAIISVKAYKWFSKYVEC